MLLSSTFAEERAKGQRGQSLTGGLRQSWDPNVHFLMLNPKLVMPRGVLPPYPIQHIEAASVVGNHS